MSNTTRDSSVWLERRSHNPDVAGSNPVPAICSEVGGRRPEVGEGVVVPVNAGLFGDWEDDDVWGDW